MEMVMLKRLFRLRMNSVKSRLCRPRGRCYASRTPRARVDSILVGIHTSPTCERAISSSAAFHVEVATEVKVSASV